LAKQTARFYRESAASLCSPWSDFVCFPGSVISNSRQIFFAMKSVISRCRGIVATFREVGFTYTSAVTTTDTMQQMLFQPASGYSKVWLRG